MVVIARRVVTALDNGEEVEAAFGSACRAFFGESDRYGDSSRMAGTVYNELCGMMKDESGAVDKRAMEEFFRQVAQTEVTSSLPPDETTQASSPVVAEAPEEPETSAKKPPEAPPAGFSLRDYEEKTTRLCPRCRARVPLSFTVCPSCGEKQPRSFWSRLFGS